MLTKQTDLAATISTRICHDLISPIGAISNGLELLEMANTPHSSELDLITQSVINANAKIRYLRIAFGDASANPKETREILTEYYSNPRLKLVWAITEPLEQTTLKLLFLLLLCAEKITPLGGSVHVSQTTSDIELLIKGQDLCIDDFWDFSANRFQPQNGPSNIQFNLAQSHLDIQQTKLCLTRTPPEVIMTITPS